jgi:hypothetical protein
MWSGSAPRNRAKTAKPLKNIDFLTIAFALALQVQDAPISRKEMP